MKSRSITVHNTKVSSSYTLLLFPVTFVTFTTTLNIPNLNPNPNPKKKKKKKKKLFPLYTALLLLVLVSLALKDTQEQMSNIEAQDMMAVMTVESFSQLPFLRPAPPRDKQNSMISKPPLRLFGFEVSQDPNITQQSYDQGSHATNICKKIIQNESAGTTTGDAGKRFGCRYCSRNFPTSQALGGHQNAHKRERQHAKRLQLQSLGSNLHHGPPSIVEGQVISFHSLSSFPSFSHNQYPINGGLRTVLQPINGNPVPCLWRAYGDGGVGTNNPLFGREDCSFNVGGLSADTLIKGINSYVVLVINFPWSLPFLTLNNVTGIGKH
ncbi:putative transcription factor C2H2 family [Dioscorea sansibarensis]